MNRYQIERLCAWSGMFGVVIFFGGFLISGFIPPPSPSLSVEQVVTHYQGHANEIRAGMVMLMISGMFVLPMFGLITAQMRRIEGVTPAVSYAQLCAGATNAMFFFIPALMFVVTAYRPDRSPELTFLLNDMAWIMAVLPWPPAFMQNIMIATAILQDKSEQPIFPRWVAYMNIWVALAFIPGGLLPFFKSGPFAWNGILVFWLAGSTFFIWFVAMTATLLKAINRQEREASLVKK